MYILVKVYISLCFFFRGGRGIILQNRKEGLNKPPPKNRSRTRRNQCQDSPKV